MGFSILKMINWGDRLFQNDPSFLTFPWCLHLEIWKQRSTCRAWVKSSENCRSYGKEIYSRSFNTFKERFSIQNLLVKWWSWQIHGKHSLTKMLDGKQCTHFTNSFWYCYICLQAERPRHFVVAPGAYVNCRILPKTSTFNICCIPVRIY